MKKKIRNRKPRKSKKLIRRAIPKSVSVSLFGLNLVIPTSNVLDTAKGLVNMAMKGPHPADTWTPPHQATINKPLTREQMRENWESMMDHMKGSIKAVAKASGGEATDDKQQIENKPTEGKTNGS